MTSFLVISLILSLILNAILFCKTVIKAWLGEIGLKAIIHVGYPDLEKELYTRILYLAENEEFLSKSKEFALKEIKKKLHWPLNR